MGSAGGSQGSRRSPGGSGEQRRVPHLRDLGTIPAVPIGTRVMVDEDQKAYIGVGFTSPEIANRLGWDQENIWMPEHALQ